MKFFEFAGDKHTIARVVLSICLFSSQAVGQFTNAFQPPPVQVDGELTITDPSDGTNLIDGTQISVIGNVRSCPNSVARSVG